MRFFRYLMRTTDVDRARAFYESILGDRSPPIALLPESAIARGARPHWLGIIGVKDLELRTEAFVARGAQPLGVPGHTGLSLLRDPGGALVALASSPEKWGASEVEVVWHQLHTNNVALAMTTYCELFGWQPKEVTQVDAFGPDHPFAWTAGEESVGAMSVSCRARPDRNQPDGQPSQR